MLLAKTWVAFRDAPHSVQIESSFVAADLCRIAAGIDSSLMNLLSVDFLATVP